MLIRISLIIAILAALAVGALNFVKVKEKIITLKDQRDTEQKAKVEAQTELASTKDTLDKTSKKLKQTEETLVATSAERDTARAEAEAQTKKAAELTDKLAKTTDERNAAQQELAAYKSIGYKPEQILAFGKQIKDAQEALDVAIEEKKILTRKLVSLQSKYDYLTKEDYHVLLPASLNGKILVTDPKWEFVILDVGQNQNVLENGELLVNRNGKLVAKVRVLKVDKNSSVANVMPGWKIGEPMEGDRVIAAYPAQ